MLFRSDGFHAKWGRAAGLDANPDASLPEHAENVCVPPMEKPTRPFAVDECAEVVEPKDSR